MEVKLVIVHSLSFFVYIYIYVILIGEVPRVLISDY